MSKKDEARSRALRDAIGALGYPGFVNLFTEMEREFLQDPGIVLMAALACERLEERVIEALPWLVLRFEHLDWEWLVAESKRRGVQNRLGFVVGMALRVAAEGRVTTMERLTMLSGIEERLFECRVEREDAKWPSVPPPQRESLRERRSREARQWGLLSDLRIDDLVYVGEV
ncbi:MAG: hypothetical protein HY821_12470 [Acidobacteria bacterium]|nr:hypothetical protein [Acidobacteriota bacterium]